MIERETVTAKLINISIGLLVTGMIASLVYIIYALVTNSADDLLLPILFSSSCGIALVSITGTDDAS
ncbi:conserved hypothetical protein containing ABC-type Mn2+/Zn2+ transport systems, permease components domain [Pseudolactococcus piscium]|nr:conserved hypothetical protein containing ABC-type Mn2+/Zn2+ transport systems, permease components domain [Lactococcus piscium]